jgi:hypothetical protein
MENWRHEPKAQDPVRWVLAFLTIAVNFYGGYAAGAAAFAVGGLMGVTIAIIGLYGTITLMELARYHIIGLPPMIATWGWTSDKAID